MSLHTVFFRPCCGVGGTLVIPLDGIHWASMKIIVTVPVDLPNDNKHLYRDLMNTLEENAYDLVLTDPVQGAGITVAHNLKLPARNG